MNRRSDRRYAVPVVDFENLVDMVNFDLGLRCRHILIDSLPLAVRCPISTAVPVVGTVEDFV